MVSVYCFTNKNGTGCAIGDFCKPHLVGEPEHSIVVVLDLGVVHTQSAKIRA